MRVTVNGEPREIASARVDALLAELEYEGTHFAIARELRRAAEKPLGRDAAEGRRRDRDHHAAAGRVMGMALRSTLRCHPRLDRATQYAAGFVGSIAGLSAYWIPDFAGMT